MWMMKLWVKVHRKDNMKNKSLIKILKFGILATSTMLLVIFFVLYANKVESMNNIVTPPIQIQLVSSSPVTITIPKINIVTNIVSLGLTKNGAMESPTLAMDAGWFNLGPRPGEVGSAVIDGHSGYKDGRQAVFDHLNLLSIGDKIYVKDVSGNTTTFVVKELKTYNRNADASKVFISSDGKSHLNLITCIGIWNALEKTHSDRLIVFADKE